MPIKINMGTFSLEVETEESACQLLQEMTRPLTYKQVANILGISERTLRRWRHNGKLTLPADSSLTVLQLLKQQYSP